MHFGIMTTVDFAGFSLGMLMIHLFTFQSSWFSELKWRSPPLQTASPTSSSLHFTQARPVRSRLLPANERKFMMIIPQNIRRGVCLLVWLLIPMALFWWVCTLPAASSEEAVPNSAKPQVEASDASQLNKENYIIDLSHYFYIP